MCSVNKAYKMHKLSKLIHVQLVQNLLHVPPESEILSASAQMSVMCRKNFEAIYIHLDAQGLLDLY